MVVIEPRLLCESSNFGRLMNASSGREDERAAVLLVGLQRLDTGREDERVAVQLVWLIPWWPVYCASSTRCTVLFTDASPTADELVCSLSH